MESWQQLCDGYDYKYQILLQAPLRWKSSYCIAEKSSGELNLAVWWPTFATAKLKSANISYLHIIYIMMIPYQTAILLNYPGLPSGVLGCPRISVGDGDGGGGGVWGWG